MAITKVNSLIDKAATVIQDRTNIRWDKDELLGWLNESYQNIVLLRPDANTNTEFVTLQPGTKQEIPSTGVKFVTLTRNNVGGTAIRYVDRSVLDDQIPDWHAAPETGQVEHFVYDLSNPRVFYVYPQAASGARVELVYSSVPTPHAIDDIATDTIGLDDRYAPAILDYILYRAYQKDADYAANDQRSASAYQTFLNSLGVQNATPTSQS